MSAGAIARAAGLLLLGSLASRLLGLGREQVIAALYGASATTSAFATAATIPTMIYDLLIGGAVTAALVPVFSQYRRTGAERDLGQVMGTLLLLGGLGLALLSVGVVLAAPLLVGLLAPGQEPALFAQTVLFAQLVGPSVIFLGLAGVTGALLMACDRFGYTALAQSAYNGGIILGALLLSPVLGPAALCVGVLGGSALQLLFQLLGLRGLSLRLGVAFGHPGLRQIVRLYAPVAAGLVVSQIGVAIDRHLAWQTGEESVAVMRFATTLVQLPLGLVGTATGLAVLPVLSRLSAENPAEQAAFRTTLAMGIRLSLLGVLPLMVGLVVLRVPVIAILFERQAFDARATALTALAFLLYAPQMPFWAVDQLLIFAFYARRDTLTPMLVGLLGVGLYLATGLPLSRLWGMPGLVLANTVQNSLHAVVLYGLLCRRWGGLGGQGIEGLLWRAGLAAAAEGLVLSGLLLLAEPLLAQGWLSRLLTTVGLASLGLGVYLAVLRGLRTPDLATLWALVRQRVGRRRPVPLA
jgi:putative peptidoglycan lipid II flippase